MAIRKFLSFRSIGGHAPLVIGSSMSSSDLVDVQGVYVSIADPVDSQDAVTKGWVDQYVATGFANVVAVYSRNYAQSGSAGTRIDFNVQEVDTDSAVTTGASTWKFTCPAGKGGWYSIVFHHNQSEDIGMMLYKNNAVVNHANTHFINYMYYNIQLAAGDYIDMRAESAFTGSSSTQAIYIIIRSMSKYGI